MAKQAVPPAVERKPGARAAAPSARLEPSDEPIVLAHVAPREAPPRPGGPRRTPRARPGAAPVDLVRPSEVVIDVNVLAPTAGDDEVRHYVFAVEAKPARGAQAAYSAWSAPLFSPVVRLAAEQRELHVRVAGRYGGVGMLWEGNAVLSPAARKDAKLRLDAGAVPWMDEQLRAEMTTPETPGTPDMWITMNRPLTGLVPVPPPRRPLGDDRRPTR